MKLWDGLLTLHMSFSENGNLKEKDILVLPLDLTDTRSHEAATKAVLQEFGKIDILVNNGGRSQRSLVLETNLDVFKELINLNYIGTVSLTKCVLPHMVERKQGKIVTVNSIAGIASTSLSSGYCASKHALRGFFNSLHGELGKYPGITLCNVYPGPVQSDIVKNALTEEVMKVKNLGGDPSYVSFVMCVRCLSENGSVKDGAWYLVLLQCLVLIPASGIARLLLIRGSPGWIHHSHEESPVSLFISSLWFHLLSVRCVLCCVVLALEARASPILGNHITSGLYILSPYCKSW